MRHVKRDCESRYYNTLNHYSKWYGRELRPIDAELVKDVYLNLARRYMKIQNNRTEKERMYLAFPDQELLSSLIWYEDVLWECIVSGLTSYDKSLAKTYFRKERKRLNLLTQTYIKYELSMAI